MTSTERAVLEDNILRFNTRQECEDYIRQHNLNAWPHRSFTTGKGDHWIACFEQDDGKGGLRVYGVASPTTGIWIEEW